MSLRCSIVCEGGGTKIAYSAGVLKCLLEHEIQVPYCVGISAGAEVLLPFVSRQVKRLEVTGIDAPSQDGVVGWKPFVKEGSIFGIEATNNYIEEQTPLDFETFFENPCELDIGVYDTATHSIEYFGKEFVDESMTLVKASCALLLLAKPYEFKGRKVIDAGLVDMISIKQAIKKGCVKHIVISTKEAGYVRKPAPAWQRWLAALVYRDRRIVEDLKNRHIRYNEQWSLISALEEAGACMVLRPHKDMGISRYTTSREKLEPWFQLGYDETLERLDEIRRFLKEPVSEDVVKLEKELAEKII